MVRAAGTQELARIPTARTVNVDLMMDEGMTGRCNWNKAEVWCKQKSRTGFPVRLWLIGIRGRDAHAP
jgi:hypothetical protein